MVEQQNFEFLFVVENLDKSRRVERVSPQEILNIIEILRKQLVSLAQNRTLIDPEVVQLSQRLDECLNMYYYVQCRNVI